MKLSELLADLAEVEVTGLGDPEIAGLTADSRAVRAGWMFAALQGVQADGAAFIPQALEAGAVAVLGRADLPAQSAPTARAANPRETLALMAARFYPLQPATIAAVTGTNGKTSTVDFLRQIWARAGLAAAGLGTLGVTRGDGTRVDLGHTTPDPVAVHRSLDVLAREGVTHLAMEASSHGLDQRRLDGVRLKTAAFTNLTQDHLDYHPDLDSYFAAKLRLFTEVLPEDGVAVINVDTDFGARVREACLARGVRVMSVGWRGEHIRLREVTPRPASQDLDILVHGRAHLITLPLAGEFQTLNALQALGLALATGADEAQAVESLAHLKGVRGRMEAVGTTPAGAPVFVDYAHTPDGLDKLLRSLRPHTSGRIVAVFGCGGDRDPIKRAPMGEIAARLADAAIITDDNPRSEDPAAIRAAVAQGAPEAVEIADRAEAIRAGVAMLGRGDALVIAGKGHETGQIVGDQVIPFDDAEHARIALAALSEAQGGA